LQYFFSNGPVRYAAPSPAPFEKDAIVEKLDSSRNQGDDNNDKAVVTSEPGVPDEKGAIFEEPKSKGRRTV
jgi:hypothetical protein